MAASTSATPRATKMQRSISADGTSPSSVQADLSTLSSPISPNSLYPLARRPSCLSRTLSTRSASSSSSNTSNRSVRFCEKVPNVKFTYPKEVYDRAPIVVDENLALKRCREMQDQGENSGPAKWVVDCFYASNGVAVPPSPSTATEFAAQQDHHDAPSERPSILVLGDETQVAGSLDSAASGDSLPSLSSDCSASSCEASECSDAGENEDDDGDDDDRTSNGTYSPMPSRMVSHSVDPHSSRFFESPRAVASPVSYSHKQAPSSPAQPNFMRWDLPLCEPLHMMKEPLAGKTDSIDHDKAQAERERRRLLRLKMQESARKQESSSTWEDCLGGF